MTRRRGRCKRAPVRLFCHDHVWQPFTGFVSSLTLILLFTNFYSDVVKPIFGSEPESLAPPASTEECLLRLDDEPLTPRVIIDRWYCETQFANIWVEPPTMLEENKHQLETHFAAFDPRRHGPEPGLDERLYNVAESRKDSYGLERIFTRFGDYSSRFSQTIGQVRALQKLTNGPAWSDWLVQLGTRDNPGILLYARFSVSREQVLPSDCDVGAVIGIPIATGATTQPGDLQSFQVIYELADAFQCLLRK